MLENPLCNFVRDKCKPIKIGNRAFEKKTLVKFLGIYFDEKLDWPEHIRFIKI